MAWNLPNQEIVPPRLELVRSLLEVDGPELGFFRSEAHELLLGVAADEVDDWVRWIYAPITAVERDAFLTGSARTRDLLLKPRVLVVDELLGKGQRRAWDVEGDTLSDEDLPEPSAVLPAYARDEHAGLQKTGLHLGRRGNRAHAISFSALSKLTGAWQDFWGVLAQAKGVVESAMANETELLAEATAPGSFFLEIVPANEFVFGQVAEEFERMILGSPQELQRSIESSPLRMKDSYERLLQVVFDTGSEAWFERPRGGALVTPGSASRTLRQLAGVTGLVLDQDQQIVTGQLLGISFKKRTFDFQEAGSQRILSGRLDEKFKTEAMQNRLDYPVGYAHRYQAVIEMTRERRRAKIAGRYKYRLTKLMTPYPTQPTSLT